MDNSTLVLDLLIEIACKSLRAWRAMLAVPAFARWSLTAAGRACAFQQFVTVTNVDGRKICTVNGLRHSVADQCAYADRKQVAWYRWGELHRVALPALMRYNGKLEWWLNGMLDRPNDQPTVVKPGNDLDWFDDEGCHRALAVPPDYADMTLTWTKNGDRHRDAKKCYISG